MIAYVIGPINGRATGLVENDDLISDEYDVLYVVSGNNWTECVSKFELTEKLIDSSEIDPKLIERDLNQIIEDELPDLRGRPGCKVCSDLFANGIMFQYPSMNWNVVDGKPTPVCVNHSDDDSLSWVEGSKMFITWYVLNK